MANVLTSCAGMKASALETNHWEQTSGPCLMQQRKAGILQNIYVIVGNKYEFRPTSFVEITHSKYFVLNFNFIKSSRYIFND